MANRIAYVKLFSISNNGTVLDNSSTSLSDHMTADTEQRVIEDTTYAPNSVGNPTIAEYIKLEGDEGYSVAHMDQYIIITNN